MFSSSSTKEEKWCYIIHMVFNTLFLCKKERERERKRETREEEEEDKEDKEEDKEEDLVLVMR
jgi:hypothetical protein